MYVTKCIFSYFPMVLKSIVSPYEKAYKSPLPCYKGIKNWLTISFYVIISVSSNCEKISYLFTK